MWNPFKKPSSEDDMTHRELLEAYRELSDLYTVLAERFARWDARQRGRAKAQLRDADVSGSGDVATRSDLRSPAPDVVVPAEHSGPVVGEPVFTKQQLRDFARARGLMT